LDIVNHANTREVDVEKGMVTFQDYPQKQVFGFDKYNPIYNKSNSFKSKYEKLKGDYYVPAKAMASGKTDYLKAKVVLHDPGLIADSIKFINSKGTIYQPVKLSADEFEIPVVGAPAGDALEIYALYKQPGAKTLNLGKILAASYPAKNYNVKIVPVNGASIQDTAAIRTAINRAFNPVNISFAVSYDNNFQNTQWDLNGDGVMNVDGSAFSNYSAEMKQLHALYKTSRPLASNTYYIFLINQASVSNVLGDMPRGGKF
jgi:hypothetical protein